MTHNEAFSNTKISHFSVHSWIDNIQNIHTKQSLIILILGEIMIVTTVPYWEKYFDESFPLEFHMGSQSILVWMKWRNTT